MSTEEEDCPFTYKEGEEPPRPKHTVIGTCKDCGEDAFTQIEDDKLCWACAYNRANW